MKVAIICDSFGPTPDWVMQTLTDQGVEVVSEPCKDDADIIRTADAAEIIWLIGGGVTFTGEALNHLPDCVAIIRSGSGVDNVPVKDATAKNIAVINTPQATAGPVAEGTIALLLAAYRRVPLQDRLMRQGHWGQWEHWPHAPLQGQTLGLVGFGHIAKEVAKRMAGFGVQLIVSDPVIDEQTIESFGGIKVSMDDLLATADIISLHCPLNNATKDLINADAFKRMKPTAILINAARGPVVNHADLIEAMKNNQIAVAALDAYDQEPLPADDPVCQLDNVILHPHTTAHHSQIATVFRQLGAEAAIDLSQGVWPFSCVNRTHITPRIELRERDTETIAG